MRKLRRSSNIIYRKGIIAIIERLNNDKNGNPNISAAIRAAENKAKIAGLYTQNNLEIGTVVKMGEITVDGYQLHLNIGEEFNSG